MEKRFNVMQSADSDSRTDIWYVNNVTTSEINEAVYAAFCVVAQKVLDRSTCFKTGDLTAAELAGTLGSKWAKVLMTLTDDRYPMAPEVCIKVGSNVYDRRGVLFECHFQADTVFEQMAEWEGVMNLSPKKYHRFTCESKQESFNNEPVKAYQRCHGYKPRTISLAAENQRIAKKFEVIGPMYEALGSEGMKRALSVLTAIESIKKMHGYDMADLADRLLRRKLWRDYGSDQYKQPMCYSAEDFEHGPEVWKQVDEEYVKQLIAYFRQVLADSPAPEWIKKGDMVQLKDQEKQPKKWQGKLSVWSVTGSLDYYKDAIEWFADVCTTKGKHDSMTRRVDLLEPWVEPEKPGKKAAKTKAAKARPRSDRQPDHGRAGNATTVGQAAKAQGEGRCDTAPHTTSQEPTLADRLREVLLRQLKQAA